MTHLILAIPSKGRLQDNTADFFGRAGLTFQKAGGARDYRGSLKGVPGVEVAWLSASEIARELANGTVHLGVTGLDLIHEQIPDPKPAVLPLSPLGFGHADVVVAVPQSWIDVRRMDDLDEVAAGYRLRHGRRLRVATKYVRLTRAWFAHHGIADYRIVESLGATEGAPASGAADLIVDITTTGATLAANNLKILEDGIILKSQAHLVASRMADWTEGTRAALQIILERIAAEARARDLREVKTTVADQARVARQAMERFGARAPFGAVGGGGVLTLHVPAGELWDAVEWLKQVGAETVTVGRLDYVVEARSPEITDILRQLGG
ncbi:MAG: ATP phosphoribosyltransferase [Hyphomicrobiaceae bacterium]|nr:ATP phosphoribosyltransferase [Hyphomicrobiaceae bacterium]